MKALLAALAVAVLAVVRTAADPVPLLEAKPNHLVLNRYAPWVFPDPPEPLTKRQMVNMLFPEPILGQYWIPDHDALEGAPLVDVPHDPEFLGVHVRTTGRFPIAELEPDPARKALLLRLRKPAAGLLYLLAKELKAELPGASPPQVTSMVRSWEYQTRLMGLNPNADVAAQGVPATHVLGLAFDIGRLTMTRKEDQAFRRVLDRLENAGLLVYFLEGKAQAAYHVVAVPAALHELQEAHDAIRAQANAATALAAANAAGAPQ